MDRFVENKNAPSVRFVRIRGRIVPIVGGHKSNKGAAILKDRIDHMDHEVQVAEAGRRVRLDDGSTHSWKSGFPQHFRDLGFATKKQWNAAMSKGSGPAFDSIVDKAADNMAFKVATKQVYDNRHVLFRKIDGEVRPIRAKSQDAFDFYNWRPNGK